MNKQWWHDSVIYQIYPMSFMDSNGDGIGDIRGIISRLDYLATLGIDVIWLSPVYQSPLKDNGYDISDYQAIAPTFGTMADMEALIEQANDLGIKIVMDLVVNHTSDQHRWFQEARQSIDNPYRDYYIWRQPKENGDPPDQQTAGFGGSAWTYDPLTDMYYFHLFDRSQPDLNWSNPQVRQEIHQMMNWWLDKGIAGFRMDVIDLIGKEVDQGIQVNGPNLHPYLQEMNQVSFGHKDVLTVGETWSANTTTAKLYCGEDRHELSMVFQFEHISAMWDEERGKWGLRTPDWKNIKHILSKWQLALAHEGWGSLFWNNHDLPRIVSILGHEGDLREQSAKMLGTLLHMMKGTPYIYQGEELAMTNVAYPIEAYKDLEIGNFYEREDYGYSQEEKMAIIHRNARDNARTPMQWSSGPEAGFTEGKPWLKVNPNKAYINAEAALNQKDSVFWHYHHLIALRKTYDVILDGSYELIDPDSDTSFSYIRRNDQMALLVLNNLTSSQISLKIPDCFVGQKEEVLISNQPVHLSENHIDLDAFGSLVLKYDNPINL